MSLMDDPLFKELLDIRKRQMLFGSKYQNSKYQEEREKLQAKCEADNNHNNLKHTKTKVSYMGHINTYCERCDKFLEWIK